MESYWKEIGVGNFEDLKSIFLKYFKTKSYAKNEFIMQPGDSNTFTCYIISGLVRIYHMDDNGDEKTLYLKFENSVFGNHHTTIEKMNTQYYFQCIEDTVVMIGEYSKLMDIAKKDHEICFASFVWSNRLLLEYKKDREDYLILKPIKRYKNLIMRYPDILGRVPNKYIASLIGITPVTLSRLRNKLPSEKCRK